MPLPDQLLNRLRQTNFKIAGPESLPHDINQVRPSARCDTFIQPAIGHNFNASLCQ